MIKKSWYLFALYLVLALPVQGQTNYSQPKLIVNIVVDQMRQDYLYRFWDLYSEEGFKKIVRGGYNFANTHYDYFPTYTGAGHACISTGAMPSVHGVVANDWIEKETGENMYCSRDLSAEGVGTSTSAGKMSPKNMLSTTYGDELRLATNFESRVFGVALKDRGSIMTSGHFANAAYWFQGDEGNFITSTYYMKELPDWVKDFNDKKLADKYLNLTWEPVIPIDELLKYTDADDNPFEGVFKGIERPVFPYDLKEIRKDNGDKLILSTPYGNTLTFEFVEALIKNEKLGQLSIAAPDILALSLSSPDYIGHQFGIRSMEVADTYIRLDKELANFINLLEEYVGENEFIIVLTADHGGADNSGYLQSKGYKVDRFNYSIPSKELRAYLSNQYGEDVMMGYINQQVYLDHERLHDLNINRDEIIESIQSFMRFQPGVDKVFSSESVSKGIVSDAMTQKYMNGYHPARSGDVFIALKPGWLDMYWYETGTTHGSVFTYDTHVPLLFYGKNIPKGFTYDRTDPSQIAATLSALMGITAPSGCIAQPLTSYFR